MANFEPRWDLKADSTVMIEGQTTYVRVQLSNNDTTSTDTTYTVGDDQYLQLSFSISGSGETLEERDFELYVGESMSTLVNINQGTTGTKKMIGNHTVKFIKKIFTLPTSTAKIDTYLMKLVCLEDGVWDGPEQLHFTLNTVDIVTIIDDQIANQELAGNLGVTSVDIAYNNDSEIWVTPSLIARGEKYCIGAMNYGSDSRLFVDAFGRSRRFDPDIDTTLYPNDRANRVFYPTYQMMPLTTSSLPTDNITDAGTILIPKSSAMNEEVDVLIRDTLGNPVDTGLKFNANGQLLQTFIYDSEPIDGYFKAKIVPLSAIYGPTNSPFYVGKRFKAYQMWICPDTTTNIQGDVKPGHLYQLKDNVVYPYVIKSEYINSVEYAVFEADKWNDLGVYDVSLGAGLINQERMFRILINASIGGGIDFETDANLGRIHVGEYFGHTVYPQIKASGTLVTYRILPSSPNDIRKYNLDLTADGFLVGTAYARSSDFSANDDIKLEFDVIANDKSGATVTKRFNITIIRGFGQNYLGASICPSKTFERDWFSSISTELFFDNKTYYRESDDRYGVQKIPRMLLKENFVSQSYNYTSLSAIKKVLQEKMVDPENGAPTPDNVFSMVIGNYKIVSALDSLGNVVYDLLYRELHPSGTRVDVSVNPRKYTTTDNAVFAEIFGLRQNIFKAVGEDVTNLYTDPDDMMNRGLFVPAIQGLSDEMTDTVPRFMNHPYEDDGLKPQFMPVLPVAYFKPGQAEAFFNRMLQTNEHSSMVNTEFEVHGVEFTFHTSQYELYVQDKFIIPIISKTL